MSYLTVDHPGTSSDKTEDEKKVIDDLEVDNSKSVLLKIATLYADQLMSDLTIEVGGVGYPAHRLILCASSEVFQVMLMNREWSEWRETRIVLQETPTAASVFPHFLKYFYTGQIKISHQTVLPVLSLADKYNVKDLVSLCLGYMSQHIALAARRGKLISWMQYTMACGHNDVAKACQNFVKWNLEWVWSDGELHELEGDTLVALLHQSDLVLRNEMTLYQFVVRWLSKQRERFDASDLDEAEIKSHWDSLVVAVFSHVRFPMMCPNQLAKLLLCPLTQQHKEFFMERMAIAMSYQSGQHNRYSSLQSTEAGRVLFTPRLYTDDTWGSILAIDNFHSLPCYHTRTFIFSSRSSIADVSSSGEKLLEWTVDLYPKGVWFKKSLLINWTGNYDVPEVVLRTVRIAITCQSCPEYIVDEDGEYRQLEPDIRVKCLTCDKDCLVTKHYQETVVLEKYRLDSLEKCYRKQRWFRAREKLLKRYLLPIYKGSFNGEEGGGTLTGFYFDGCTHQVYRLAYYPMYSPIIGTLQYDFKLLSRVPVVHRNIRNKPRWTDTSYFGKFSYMTKSHLFTG